MTCQEKKLFWGRIAQKPKTHAKCQETGGILSQSPWAFPDINQRHGDPGRASQLFRGSRRKRY
jgi:hypothetical protein